MANEEQKTNTNGRPVLVLSKENLGTVAQTSQTASDWLGYVKDAGDVFKAENFNFKWGLIHSKNPPILSKERLKKITDFKMYSRNSENGRIFSGNPHTKVFNTKKALNSIDKLGSISGHLGDGTEILLAVSERDSKALASKTSTLVLSKVGETSGETVGVAVAGKCVKFAAKKIDPKRIAIAGGICAIAAGTLKYGGKTLGDKLGSKLGETDTAIKTADAIFKSMDVLDKMDDEAEKRRRQREIEKDPMLEWHLTSAD